MKQTKEEKKAQKEKDLFEFLGKIDLNYFNTTLRQREIALFCKTLYSYMGFIDKVKFYFNGEYANPCKKTFKDLLTIKQVNPNLNEHTILDFKFYKDGIRKSMTELCVNLLSNMNANYRFMYIVAGYHNVPIMKTYKKLQNKREKDRKKDLKKRDKAIKKQNKVITKKNKKRING